MNPHLKSIPQSELWAQIALVDKGWSKDEKYHIITTDGDELLLRVARVSEYDRKLDEFRWMERLSYLNVPLPMPLDFGTFADNQYVFSLLTWMRGRELDAFIPHLQDVEAYNIGVKAGEILRKIHSMPVENDSIHVQAEMRAIFDKKLALYRECGISVPNETVFIDYIESNFHLLKDVEACFLHGDYHVGNMILSDDNDLSIIDFNRYRLGDPCRDFNRLAVFSRLKSEAFARGQIDGYWGRDNISEDFFARMSFYIAFDNFFSILWAIPFGDAEIENALSRANLVFADFQGFTSSIPSWYK